MNALLLAVTLNKIESVKVLLRYPIEQQFLLSSILKSIEIYSFQIFDCLFDHYMKLVAPKQSNITVVSELCTMLEYTYYLSKSEIKSKKIGVFEPIINTIHQELKYVILYYFLKLLFYFILSHLYNSLI